MRFDDAVLDRLPLSASMARAQSAIQSRYIDVWPTPADAGSDLMSAMGHALVGGKMLRGFLAIESARLHGIGGSLSIDPALAIECIHAYSLVHDDLPCMDDDDLRRGQPTVHKKWNEATAVLAGDALQTLAFELLADRKYGVQTADLIKSLAQAAGRNGMVEGQAMDIAAETAARPLNLNEITVLQEKKTGALIQWACSVGPLLADDADEGPLRTYSKALGLAFQIADDILDITGDAGTVGKATGKDEEAGKATFVSLLGLDEAKRRAKQLVDEACEALSIYRDDAETLREAARFVISRDM